MAKVAHHHCDGCTKDLGSGTTDYYEVHAPGAPTTDLCQVCLGIITGIFRAWGYTRDIDKNVRNKPSQVQFSVPQM